MTHLQCVSTAWTWGHALHVWVRVYTQKMQRWAWDMRAPLMPGGLQFPPALWPGEILCHRKQWGFCPSHEQFDSRGSLGIRWCDTCLGSLSWHGSYLTTITRFALSRHMKRLRQLPASSTKKNCRFTDSLGGCRVCMWSVQVCLCT